MTKRCLGYSLLPWSPTAQLILLNETVVIKKGRIVLMNRYTRNILACTAAIIALTSTSHASSLKSSCPAVKNITETKNETDKRIDYTAMIDGNLWTSYHRQANIGDLKKMGVTLNAVSIEDKKVQCYYQSKEPNKMGMTLVLADLSVQPLPPLPPFPSLQTLQPFALSSGQAWKPDAKDKEIQDCIEQDPARCRFNIYYVTPGYLADFDKS
ncbi:hypothetical protein RINTU1_00130 [Candidatus Regiella insecticola]|uniref:Uncharacterized protein n=2 Tax=Candidatus Regiella insecticola TaxID=138073 RepID=A0A6L2ZKS1_9ENTR|nr:hypothetical protein RINTU1_00130 [Candidatus Regiella insecticola]